jgi:hypothetical protein
VDEGADQTTDMACPDGHPARPGDVFCPVCLTPLQVSGQRWVPSQDSPTGL